MSSFVVTSPRALEFACHSAACAPPSAGGTGGSLGGNAKQFPGTPGYTPRTLTKAQAEYEINEDIRDSGNGGYGFDDREAGQWLEAFNTMRRTGKSAEYGDYRYEQTVHPGDTSYFAKMDYEVTFRADTVAAYLGRPLSSEPTAKASPGRTVSVPKSVAPKAKKVADGEWSVGAYTVRKNPKGSGYLLSDPKGKVSKVKTVGGAVSVVRRREKL